jgi:hypothetical protein
MPASGVRVQAGEIHECRFLGIRADVEPRRSGTEPRKAAIRRESSPDWRRVAEKTLGSEWLHLYTCWHFADFPFPR